MPAVLLQRIYRVIAQQLARITLQKRGEKLLVLPR